MMPDNNATELLFYMEENLRLRRKLADLEAAGLHLRERDDALRATIATMQGILRAAPIGIGTVKDRVLGWVNESFCHMLGYSIDELVGRDVRMLYEDEAEYQRVGRTVYPAAQRHGVAHIETCVRAKDGPLLDVLLSIAAIEPDNMSAGFVFTLMDVSAVSRSQMELRASEDRYRMIFQELIDGFALHEIILDANGTPCDYRFLAVNPAFERLTGLKAADITGKTVREILPGIESLWIERYGRVALTGEPAHFESYAAPLDRYFEVAAYCPAPGRFACTFTDISERKRAERELRLTQFAVDRASDGAFWMGPDAKLIYANDAACRILGYSRAELLQMTVHDIDPDFPPDKWRLHWEEVRRRGSFTMQSRHRTKEGRILPVEVTVNYIEFEGRAYNCAFVRYRSI